MSESNVPPAGDTWPDRTAADDADGDDGQEEGQEQAPSGADPADADGPTRTATFTVRGRTVEREVPDTTTSDDTER